MLRVGAPDLRASLVAFGHGLLDAGRVLLPVMVMSWSNPSGDYSLEKIMNRREGIRQPLRSMTAFLRAEMDLARLPRMHVEVLGGAFLGAPRDYCTTELLFRDDPQRPTKEVFVQSLADLLFFRTAQ